jgi:hypothetical protein
MSDLQNITDETVDIGANIAPLYSYVFTAVTGSVTLKGFYLDKFGRQVGAAVSYTITTATSLLTLSSGTFPAGAFGSPVVGFCGILSAAVYVGMGGQPDGTVAVGQSPANGYPQIPAGTYNLGRVSSLGMFL